MMNDKIYDLEFKKKLALKDYQQTIKYLDDKISEIRKSCPHENVSFNPDPSGNNDSYMSCDVCGEERKRF